MNKAPSQASLKDQVPTKSYRLDDLTNAPPPDTTAP